MLSHVDEECMMQGSGGHAIVSLNSKIVLASTGGAHALRETRGALHRKRERKRKEHCEYDDVKQVAIEF